MTPPTRDARVETSAEMRETLALAGDPAGLRRFWEERYAHVYGTVLEELAEFGRHGVIAEYLNRLLPRGTVVDLGCGTGILSELLDLPRLSYVGVDISHQAIEHAERHRSRAGVRYLRQAIEEFTPTDAVAAVVFNEALYYMDAGEAVARAAAWLQSPRLMVVSVFDFPEGSALLERLRAAFEPRAETVVTNPPAQFTWTVLVFEPTPAGVAKFRDGLSARD